MSDIEFKSFSKIARLNRDVVVTEKIDGTNAVIYVTEGQGGVIAGSRNGWLTLENDNHGFARWVHEHAQELADGLGHGYHYGEWWGAGIQRRYGLEEKRFSLFNVGRWGDERFKACTKCQLQDSTWAPAVCTRCKTARPAEPPKRPACCHVVPVLYRGPYQLFSQEALLFVLRQYGSAAAPGFMRPEGIVIFHTASGSLFKTTLEKDAEPKGKAA